MSDRLEEIRAHIDCPTCGAPAVVTERFHVFGCARDGEIVGQETDNEVCTCEPQAYAWRFEGSGAGDVRLRAALERLVGVAEAKSHDGRATDCPMCVAVALAREALLGSERPA